MIAAPQLNPIADMLGRMIFVGIPTRQHEPRDSQDSDEGNDHLGDPHAAAVERAEIQRTIAERLREARVELCQLSQQEAAKLMGVSLRLLRSHEEPAADRRASDPVFMTRASTFYDVSMDWLYGRTDDFERCSRAHRERHSQLFTLRQIAINHAEQMEHIRRLYDWHEAEIKSLEGIVEQTKAAIEAAEWFTSRPGFEDTPGSAPVARGFVE